MMRNEHIVRAHQTPEVGNNTNGLPWNIIHVDNSAPAGGNGTVQAPFNTLEQGNLAADAAGDVVFVHTGNGTYNQTAAFTPQFAEQLLIGDGAMFCLDTTCGPINMQLTNTRPTISNGSGASVILGTGGGGGPIGFTTANFIVSGSRIGVEATNAALAGSTAEVINYKIEPGSTGGFHTGLQLTGVVGEVNVVNTSITDMNDTGIKIDGGTPTLTYQGTVSNDNGLGTGSTSPLIDIRNTTGGTISIAAGSTPGTYQAGDPNCLVATTVQNSLSDIGGGGIVIDKSNSDITMDNLTITNSVNEAISVTNSGGNIKIGLGGPATITQIPGTLLSPSAAGIVVDGADPTFTYSGSITNLAGSGNAVFVNDTGPTGSVTVTNPGDRSSESGAGLVVSNSSGDVTIENFNITDTTGPGILAQNN
ncbi:MAG: hypothetical protein GY881_13315, partial [Gammaproteobacteria bacterium]|nr:hypothetical protein [Gammaproteobacteria bacterium]